MVLLNNVCVKSSSMAPQAYKVVNIHVQEISVWTVLSNLLHARSSHLWGMNGDVQYDISTLTFNNVEQLEYLHRRILILQQEIILSGATVSTKRLLFKYMKAF